MVVAVGNFIELNIYMYCFLLIPKYGSLFILLFVEQLMRKKEMIKTVDPWEDGVRRELCTEKFTILVCFFVFNVSNQLYSCIFV